MGFGPVFAQKRFCYSLRDADVRLPLLGIREPQRYAGERPPKQHIRLRGKKQHVRAADTRQRQQAARINRDGLHPAIHAHRLAGHRAAGAGDRHARARLPLPRPDAGRTPTHRGCRGPIATSARRGLGLARHDARPGGAALAPPYPPALAAPEEAAVGAADARAKGAEDALEPHRARRHPSPRVRRGRHGPEVSRAARLKKEFEIAGERGVSARHALARVGPARGSIERLVPESRKEAQFRVVLRGRRGLLRVPRDAGGYCETRLRRRGPRDGGREIAALGGVVVARRPFDGVRRALRRRRLHLARARPEVLDEITR